MRGNSRNALAGATGSAKPRGKPQASAPDVLKDARFEATRRSIAGKAGRCGNQGNPGDASTGADGIEEQGDLNFTTVCAEGRERRGNSKLSRRQRLKMQDAGQLATSSRGATGNAKPRGWRAGRAEGCEIRGDLKLHRGRSL
jgi:hypothetical protein